MNFPEAALRHYEDGEILYKNNRIDNSDQLFGYSAECAIKSCLLPRCFKNGDLDKNYWTHINVLWNRISININSKAFPTLGGLLKNNQPFGNWDVNNRYEKTGYINRSQCEIHRRWTVRILGSIGLLGKRN